MTPPPTTLPPPMTTIPPPPPTTTVPLGPPGVCSIYGDPHIVTFDHKHASYYTPGEYWIVKSSTVIIQGKYAALPSTNGLAVVKGACHWRNVPAWTQTTCYNDGCGYCCDI